jgi:hypothetical protein
MNRSENERKTCMMNMNIYMYMCPAENKQVFLSFYSYLNITGREKKERKRKKSLSSSMK